MTKVFIVGTYDTDPVSLFTIDLMRYVGAAGVQLAGVVYKTTAAFRTAVPFNEPVSAGDGRVVIRSDDFASEETVSALRAARPDLLVYAGGRDILREPLLSVAPLGCIGGHYGRLPDIRGMGTVEWSVLLGVPPTVAIQRIGTGIDTGDILMQASVRLKRGDTYSSIRERSYFMTKLMLAFSTGMLAAGCLNPMPQDPHEGRQYYRLHPAVQALAERRLGAMLERLSRGS